jgi:hypothetical protein
MLQRLYWFLVTFYDGTPAGHQVVLFEDVNYAATWMRYKQTLYMCLDAPIFADRPIKSYTYLQHEKCHQ